MAGARCSVARGMLLTTDEQTVVFLQVMEEQLAVAQKFIIRRLDSTHLFVRESRMAVINAALQRRLGQTIFTEEDELAERRSAGGDE